MGVVTSHRSGGRRRWLAVATAAALIVAACGDDDSNDADDVGADDTEAAGTDTTPDAGTAADDTTDDTTAATEAPDDTGDTGAPAGDARELIIARDMDLTTLDPQRAYCDTCQIFMTAVYETLIGVDPTDLTMLVPRLAESWEANAENTEFTFTLNPDGDVRRRLAGHRGRRQVLVGAPRRPRRVRRRTWSAASTIDRSPRRRRPSSSRWRRPTRRSSTSSARRTWASSTRRSPRPTAPPPTTTRQRRAVVPRATRPAADRSCSSPTPRATSCVLARNDAYWGAAEPRSRGSPLKQVQGRHGAAPAAPAGRRRHRDADQLRLRR